MAEQVCELDLPLPQLDFFGSVSRLLLRMRMRMRMNRNEGRGFSGERQ